MTRKKLYNEITGWTGWFFCEVAFRVYRLEEVKRLWSDESDKWVWWFRPVGWAADRSYDLGSWFYNLEKD
ncbi:MAG: hypothetical protein KAV87_30400 [Desulfobacteraceae bacterium]|nr:hypothetical protein [Desulfobacteraceae bacterium]